jgi:hypothetical protein
MKKGIVHLGSAHSTTRPARPSGPAPLGVLACDRRNRGGGLLHGCWRRWLPILASRRRGGSGSGARAARWRGELNSGGNREEWLTEAVALRRWAVGRRGTTTGVASGGDGQGLAVQEGGTRWRGARGGDEELRGEPGAALHGGSTAVEQRVGWRKAIHGGGGGVGLPF